MWFWEIVVSDNDIRLGFQWLFHLGKAEGFPGELPAMISQSQVGTFNERSIDGIAYFWRLYRLVNELWITEDDFAFDLNNFAIFSDFVDGGIL